MIICVFLQLSWEKTNFLRAQIGCMAPEGNTGMYHSEVAISLTKSHLDYLKHIAMEEWGDNLYAFWVGLYYVGIGSWETR